MELKGLRLTGLTGVLLAISCVAGFAADGARAANWSAPATWAAGEGAEKALPSAPLPFVAIAPCRLLDTRDATMPTGYGPPALTLSGPRDFVMTGNCGVPVGAQAISVNVTVTGTQGPGFVALFPAGDTWSGTSSVNYTGTGQTVANAAITPLGATGGFSALAGVSGADLIVDVNGYYGGSGAGGSVITSVTAGSGLTGGGTSGDVTVGVAAQGITSGMIANGAVGSAQVNASQVQARVSGTCTAGQYLAGINANGTVVCHSVRGQPLVTLPDDPAVVAGGPTSIAIGTDGLPIVAYVDTTAPSRIRIAKCRNASCSLANVTFNAILEASATSWPSMAIGTDGFPVISCFDGAQGALKVYKCGDAVCSGAATITSNRVDNPANLVGVYSSMGIGTDGFPVISYYDATTLDLKVAKCADAVCTPATAAITTVDSMGSVGVTPSLAIGTDGFPIISYYDSTNLDLKVAKCINAACAGTSTITTVDSAGDVGETGSIVIGTDGFPIISYYDRTNLDLKVAKCVNAACTGTSTITTVDSTANVGYTSSIAIGADGLPVISYREQLGAQDLKVAKCINAACTGTATITTLDSPGTVGSYSSIAIGGDGLPVISYLETVGNHLKIVKCGTESCQ